MRKRLKHGNLLSDRSHGFPFALSHWATNGSRAVGRLVDRISPRHRISSSLLDRVRCGEVVLSIDGEYWKVSFSERGRIEDAVRVERPVWLDDSLRFLQRNRC